MEAVDDLSITPADEGASLLAVKAVPGATRPRIAGVLGTALKVAVAQPPEGGAANRAICALVAEALQLPRGSVTLHAGHSNPRKTLRCDGLLPETLRERLRDR